jgi:hypothetical protein
MTPTFDPTKSHGTVFGDHEIGHPMLGAAYEQDGFYFDAKRRFLPNAVTEEQTQRLAELAAREAALVKAREAYAAATGVSVEEATEVLKVAKVGDATEEAVDLERWGLGLERYPFDRITKKIRDDFNVGVTNKRQALEVLSSRGIIPGGAAVGTIPELS